MTFVKSAEASDPKRVTWFFQNIYLQTTWTHDPLSPDAGYMYTIGPDDMGPSEYFFGQTTYSKIKPILRFLNLRKPQKLLGLKFQTPIDRGDGGTAFEWLSMAASHGGIYVQKNHEVLIDRAARALAEFKQPNFEDVMRVDLAETMRTFFHDGFEKGDHFMIKRFSDKVHQYSNQRVTLVEVPPEQFAFRLRGAANYFILRHIHGAGAGVVLAPTSRYAFHCIGCGKQNLSEVVGAPCRQTLSDLAVKRGDIWSATRKWVKSWKP